MDLGQRGDGRARIRGGGALVDGDGRAEAIDAIDIRFFDLIKELAGIGRERFDIAALAFGVERVESEGRFAGTGHAANGDHPVPGQIDVDPLQVMGPCPADGNEPVVVHAAMMAASGALGKRMCLQAVPA